MRLKFLLEGFKLGAFKAKSLNYSEDTCKSSLSKITKVNFSDTKVHCIILYMYMYFVVTLNLHVAISSYIYSMYMYVYVSINYCSINI